MIWYYRLQQRLSMTNGECTVILTLAFLLFLGFTVRYVQSQPRVFPADTYAEGDRLFAEGTATLKEALPATGTARPVDEQVLSAPDTSHAARGSISESAEKRLELNTATASQLETLPRIGPKMAIRILEYREAHGPFRRVQDLERVRGIGKKTLALLEPLVYIEKKP